MPTTKAKRTKGYTDSPPAIARAIARAKPVRVDFLPSPEDISQSLATVKVTMHVGARSLDFYKTQSKRMKIPYQRLIRTILDDYARQYSGH